MHEEAVFRSSIKATDAIIEFPFFYLYLEIKHMKNYDDC